MASVLPKLRALGDRLRSRLGLDGGSSDTTVAVDTKDAKTSDACGAESCCRVDTGDAKNSAGCCRADDDSESQKRATVTGGKILYGSQTGTARRLAHKLANSLRTRHDVDLDVVDMADYDPEDLVKENVVLVVLSTYESADGAATGSPTAQPGSLRRSNTNRLLRPSLWAKERTEVIKAAAAADGASDAGDESFKSNATSASCASTG